MSKQSARDQLTLHLEGGEDVNQFDAVVRAAGFSGATGYIIDARQMQDFLGALAVFPISDPVRLSVGTEFPDGPLLSITIQPADRRGTLSVHVSLAADDDRSRKVSTHFRCVHSDVEHFADQLQIALGSGGTAVLAAAEFLG
ncbi:hypothetical protein [Sphingomonas colocasiae]|uniref:Uncharacterized protein n=1 Tax=Sphingomonas colocasiae TaxID=1848973 RepID=A0ABS7PUQ5_9SPHN|nr:hypothetical protein [Sphingomonas colocasiae]MBY8825082.1 hypothetical protein [Sphingomonas colocasiae]